MVYQDYNFTRECKFPKKTVNYVIVLICSGIGASKLSQSPVFIILIQLKLHFRIFLINYEKKSQNITKFTITI